MEKKKFLKNIGKFDIIINLLKSENKNENFLNQELFKRMKKNVDLILVGRLKTVNLKDLNNFMLRTRTLTVILMQLTINIKKIISIC